MYTVPRKRGTFFGIKISEQKPRTQTQTKASKTRHTCAVRIACRLLCEDREYGICLQDSQERIRVLYIFRKIFYNEKADRVVLTSLREVKKWEIA